MYSYHPLPFPSLCVYEMIGHDTLELRRKVSRVLQCVFFLRDKGDDSETLSNVSLFVPDYYVRTGRRRHPLFVFPLRRTHRADNTTTQRALALLNCLVSEVQYAHIAMIAFANI